MRPSVNTIAISLGCKGTASSRQWARVSHLETVVSHLETLAIVVAGGLHVAVDHLRTHAHQHRQYHHNQQQEQHATHACRCRS